MGLVAASLRLFDPDPSSTCQLTVLLAATEVGLFVEFLNVTERSAFWYSRGVAVPERASVPVAGSYEPVIAPMVKPSLVKAKMSPLVSPDVIVTEAEERLVVSASVTSMPVRTIPAGDPSV